MKSKEALRGTATAACTLRCCRQCRSMQKGCRMPANFFFFRAASSFRQKTCGRFGFLDCLTSAGLTRADARQQCAPVHSIDTNCTFKAMPVHACKHEEAILHQLRFNWNFRWRLRRFALHAERTCTPSTLCSLLTCMLKAIRYHCICMVRHADTMVTSCRSFHVGLKLIDVFGPWSCRTDRSEGLRKFCCACGAQYWTKFSELSMQDSVRVYPSPTFFFPRSA